MPIYRGMPGYEERVKQLTGVRPDNWRNNNGQPKKALSWIADRDGLESGQMYMAAHQNDPDANDLWLYFQTVINWAKMMFPTARKGMTDAQEWGLLYNKYHNNQYNTNTLEADIKKLIMDDDVTKKAGIIPYVLSPRTKHDEKKIARDWKAQGDGSIVLTKTIPLPGSVNRRHAG